MSSTIINPSWLTDAAYIDFLNLGFGGDWNQANLDFYVKSVFRGKPSDIGVRADGQSIAAGVSYCYRQLRTADAPPINVCVMTAGATSPSERGKGHYLELLRTGLQLSRRNRCAAILGFVTKDNASGRGLARLGAYSIPSYYLVSARNLSRENHQRPPIRELPPAAALQLWQRMPSSAGAGFHYATAEDWLQQFVARPNPVRAVQLAHDSIALIETVGETDRLQWLGCPPAKTVACIARLSQDSRAKGRRFFMYTLDPDLAAAAARQGMGKRDGLLMLLPVESSGIGWRTVANSAWHLQSGDRL